MLERQRMLTKNQVQIGLSKPYASRFARQQHAVRAPSTPRLLETKATSTRETMDYMPGVAKVSQETKVPLSPLVAKVPLLLESRNAVEHSAAAKSSNDCCYGCVPPYNIGGRPRR